MRRISAKLLEDNQSGKSDPQHFILCLLGDFNIQPDDYRKTSMLYLERPVQLSSDHSRNDAHHTS